MHKESLQKFLSERRERISPESVGLTRPTGSGRRAPGEGLSQQQVDTLLRRGSHTYHLLETGKTKNPSAALLYDVAMILRLDEHEWVILHRYALEQNPPGPLNPDAGYRVPSSWQAAVDGIQHMAYVGDAAWNILAWNEHFRSMFPSGKVPENTLRWMCLSLEARTVLSDWEHAWAPRVLPQLRAALAARRDPTLQALETDVLADPVAGPLYEARGATIHPDGDERPLNHAVHGPGYVTMCSAQPDGAPGSRLMILLFNKEPRPGPRTPLSAPHLTRPNKSTGTT